MNRKESYFTNKLIFYKRIIEIIIIGMNKYLNTLLWWRHERIASFPSDLNLALHKSIGIVRKNGTYGQRGYVSQTQSLNTANYLLEK